MAQNSLNRGIRRCHGSSPERRHNGDLLFNNSSRKVLTSLPVDASPGQTAPHRPTSVT